MVQAERLRRHDFADAPFSRWDRNEPKWRSHLRGIIGALAPREHSPDSRAFFADFERECRGHLDALGLTLAQAKALVFPEPEKLAKPLRRSYGLRKPRQPRTRRVSPSRAETHEQAAGAVSAGDSHSPPDPPAPSARLLRPDGLPHVLYVEDLAALFGVSVPTARRNLVGGQYGPRFLVGRRWAMRAGAFLEFLKSVEERPRNATVPARGHGSAAYWERRLAKQQRRRKQA